MNKSAQIACVTGATGIIGSRIVQCLIKQGYQTRILTRKAEYSRSDVECYFGGLDNQEILKVFIKDAHLLFHCAAEINDESKMWEVNVLGTERLFNLVVDSDIEYFCYLSSVGVTGLTKIKIVNETVKCNPQNFYERSKWTAEQLVSRPIEGCRIVILRPTNVIDERNPGALLLPIKASCLDRLKVFIKGGEFAHIVHAEDVASAALYLFSHSRNSNQCFIVSNDDDSRNTFAGLWTLYNSFKKGSNKNQVMIYLPVIIPYLLRRFGRGKCNKGDVRYSSEKLLSTGFKFSLGLTGAVKQVFLANEQS